MALKLSLLGGFEACLDGVKAGFATHAARALLSYLAVQPGRACTRESLAALLWPDKPQKQAHANLRQTVARMRDGLGEAAGVAIESTPHALRFIPGAAQVDAVEFASLIAANAAHAHTLGALCEQCVAHLRAAVDLYRGDFLSGSSLPASDTFEEWALLTREQYRRQMLEALHALSAHHEHHQAHQPAREYAQRQLDLEPWREEAHAQVMRALAASGQRSAALAQYRTCCQILERELGIGPSNELRVLYERIQAGEIAPSQLDAGLPRHNLPEQLTPFIGREVELADLSRWMNDRSSRLLTLSGPGGMGKTRLAIEAARSRLDDFHDGVFFVSLAPLARADAISPAICAAIGSPMRGASALQSLLNHVAGRRMLLLLDNFEHLMAGVGIVTDLLLAAPNLRIIATSREQLNVRGETVYAIQGMAYPQPGDPRPVENASQYASVQLFEQTARRIQPAFALTARNAPAVLRITALVQGMPLGLELAATWISALHVDEIAEELQKSAGFLESQWHDLPVRQRNLRAVFDWSWRLLNADERAALCRASVFRGGFTRTAAGEIASITLQRLARLIHKSLLAQQDDGRYALHELLRQFAGERLDELPAVKADLLARHSAWYLSWLAAKERRLLRNEPVESTEEINTEIDNVRQAWLRACAQGSIANLRRAAVSLWQFCAGSGLAEEGVRMFAAAAGACTSTLESGRDAALFHAIIGSLSMVLGRHDDALAAGSRAVALAEAGDDVFAQALGWLVQGQALRRKGQTPPARALLERVTELANRQREGAPHVAPERWALLETRALNWLCSFHVVDANYEAAQRHVTRTLAVGRSLDMRRVIAVALTDRVTIAHAMGDWETVQHSLKEASQLSEQVGSLNGVAYALRMKGLLARRAGDYDSALLHMLKARKRYRDAGDAVGDAYTLLEEGMLHVLMGNFNVARERFDAGERLLHTLGEPAVELFALQCARFWLAHHGGDAQQALHLAEMACLMAQLLDISAHLGDALVLLGIARGNSGQHADAAHAFNQAIELSMRMRLEDRAIEPRAGLARLALAQRDLSQAHARVESLLPQVLSHVFAGADEPFRILNTCWRVLQAAGDPRATDVLQHAKSLLNSVASHISDLEQRRSFLENVPAHRVFAGHLAASDSATSGSDVSHLRKIMEGP